MRTQSTATLRFETCVDPILNLCAHLKIARMNQDYKEEAKAAQWLIFLYQNPGEKHKILQKYLKETLNGRDEEKPETQIS